MMLTAASLATAVTLAVTTPAITQSQHEFVSAVPLTSSVALLAHSESEADSASREIEYGDWEGLFAGFGEILGGLGQLGTNYLDNNQASVLAFTSKLPLLRIGPVLIGNAKLATAYYFGFNGSPTGGAGVQAYVIDQIQQGMSLNNLIKGFVLTVTSQIPKFYIGPVQIGGGLLADAWFNGYGGETGATGVVNYVKAQLGLPAAAKSAAVEQPSVAASVRAATKPTGTSGRAAQAAPAPRGARAAAASAPSAHKAAAASAPAKAATTHGGPKRPAA